MLDFAKTLPLKTAGVTTVRGLGTSELRRSLLFADNVVMLAL